MRGITVMILLGYLSQMCAKASSDANNGMGKLSDRLAEKREEPMDRLVNKAVDLLLAHTDLDYTTLAITGRVAIPPNVHPMFLNQASLGQLPQRTLMNAVPERGVAASITTARAEEGTPLLHGARSRVHLVASAAAAFLGLAPAITPPAHAFGIPFALEDLTYETGPCPDGTYRPDQTAQGVKVKTVCMTVRANARNTQAVDAASVFGFVQNADELSVLTVNPDGITRTGIANILKPIPKGGGPVEFTLVVFEDRIKKGPLKFKAFQAQPSPRNIEERFKPLSDCELGLAEEGCE